jgi:NifB/MoaA-like Fe-S oxidoreductase
VVCPGINHGAVLEDTMVGIADRFPELATVAVVPLGLSRYGREGRLRAHTRDEAGHTVDTVEHWQAEFLELLGRRLVFAADEYYLLAGRAFPPASTYEGFPLHEDGIGMARSLEQELAGLVDTPIGPQSGFFQWVDGAPAAGYRAPRTDGHVALRPRSGAPVGVLTGTYGARVLTPLLAGRDGVRVIPVENRFFGGNIGVTGLLVGEDLRRVLADEPPGHRYLLPDVCLSGGRFLDGTTPEDLPHPVEVVPTDGLALRHALAANARSS